MNSKIVIFDMDGTLVDSAKDITTAINLVRDDIGLAPLPVKTVVDAINGDHINLAQTFYETPTYQDDHKDRFEIYYHEECIKSVSVYEGITEMLQELKTHHIKCSVATNAPAHFAKRILGHVEIDHFFDYIYGANQHKSKPAPDMLNAILSNYRYDDKQLSQSFMVGDSKKDIQAALNAKINAVHITWGFCKEEHDLSINHPEELLKLLNIK